MARWKGLLAAMSFMMFVATGCAGNLESPVTQNPDPGQTAVQNPVGQTQTQLWGLYDVYIDMENGAAEVVPLRQTMFTANVVRFMNESPSSLMIEILNVVQGPDYADIDLNVTLTHPFPGFPQFNGYDVRGIFMGDGSGTLGYNPDLVYPVLGSDQIMLDDPEDGDGGGPDGYTRWFNYTEFSPGDMPIFSYTQGVGATPGFDGTATLNPYKYFADGLEPNDDAWNFLITSDTYGVFSQSATNTRNYYLRFPDTKEMEFGYAILANWEGLEPEYHPSNTPEAPACEVIDNSDVYYVNSGNFGGNLILDISLFGWENQPTAIYIESTVLSAVANFDPASILTGGGDHYATYHVEIPADNVTSIDGQEFWVIAEYDDFDYQNEFGVPNEAWDDPLAACFRYDLTVTEIADSGWARTWGGAGEDVGSHITLDGSGNLYITGYYSDTVDFSPNGGDPHTSNGERDTFLSKFDLSGNFQWAITWGGQGSDQGFGVAADSSGNIYVTGSYQETCDFDPVGGDPHTSNGEDDIYLSKFDSSGNLDWARTWGGSGTDINFGVDVDDLGNAYVTGLFNGTVDFDPDGGEPHSSYGPHGMYVSKFDSSGDFLWVRTWGTLEGCTSTAIAVDGPGNVYFTGNYGQILDFNPDGGDQHISNGVADAFLCKLDSSGNYGWARTWGGPWHDQGMEITLDGLGNIYVAGYYYETADFDPDGGDPRTSTGMSDSFLSKFDTSGNYIWVRTWGGPNRDQAEAVATDGFGNVYVSGLFCGTSNFDPEGNYPRTSVQDWDNSLSRFDSAGNFSWVRTWGGWDEWPLWMYHFINRSMLCTDNAGNLYVTGLFGYTADFAPVDPPCNADSDPHTSNGNRDVFLTKYFSNGCW